MDSEQPNNESKRRKRGITDPGIKKCQTKPSKDARAHEEPFYKLPHNNNLQIYTGTIHKTHTPQRRQQTPRGILLPPKDLLTILHHKLHNLIPTRHIAHLPLHAAIPHDRRRENDSHVLGRHEVDGGLGDDAGEMEDEEFEDVAVDGGEEGEGVAEVGAAG